MFSGVGESKIDIPTAGFAEDAHPKFLTQIRLHDQLCLQASLRLGVEIAQEPADRIGLGQQWLLVLNEGLRHVVLVGKRIFLVEF